MCGCCSVWQNNDLCDPSGQSELPEYAKSRKNFIARMIIASYNNLGNASFEAWDAPKVMHSKRDLASDVKQTGEIPGLPGDHKGE